MRDIACVTGPRGRRVSRVCPVSESQVSRNYNDFGNRAAVAGAAAAAAAVRCVHGEYNIITGAVGPMYRNSRLIVNRVCRPRRTRSTPVFDVRARIDIVIIVVINRQLSGFVVRHDYKRAGRRGGVPPAFP